MRSVDLRARAVPVLAAALLAAAPCRAGVILDVTLDTSNLANPANTYGAGGPYALDFALTDGGQLNNNTITISDIAYGSGGSAGGAGTISTTGGASGSLASGVTLTDSGFFADFNQQFTPGALLSFTLDLTTNVDQGPGTSPDSFTFSILDSTGMPIPTSDASASSFLTITLDGPSPTIQTYATVGVAPQVGPPQVAPPQVGPPPGPAAPEPSSLVLALIGLAGAAAARGLRRRSGR